VTIRVKSEVIELVVVLVSVTETVVRSMPAEVISNGHPLHGGKLQRNDRNPIELPVKDSRPAADQAITHVIKRSDFIIALTDNTWLHFDFIMDT
jgi:hypothetical protein